MANEKIKYKESIQKKIYLNALVDITIIILLISTSFIYFYFYSTKKEFQHRLSDLVQAVTFNINGEDYKLIKNRDDEKRSEYLKIKKSLQVFKQADRDIKFIYTLRKTNQKNILEVVVDAKDQSNEDFFHVGDKYDASKHNKIEKAFDGSNSDINFETKQWGNSFLGYAPIKDSSGKIVGIVVINIAADSIVKQERNLLIGAIIIFLISMALTIYTTKKRVERFTMPIYQIMEGVKQISSGNLDYRVKIKTNDEFEKIGDVFNKNTEILVDHKRMLEKNLDLTKKQREKIFKVYSDVIYSVTQGKFNLLKYSKLLAIEEEGVLYDQIKLNNSQDVDKARKLVEKFLKGKNYSPKQIMHIMLCTSEAATNVIKHAKVGCMQILTLGNKVRIIFKDYGPGMDLDKLSNMIFFKGFSTEISMGYGFSIIYKFSDQIYLSTSKKGTFLAMDYK